MRQNESPLEEGDIVRNEKYHLKITRAWNNKWFRKKKETFGGGFADLSTNLKCNFSDLTTILQKFQY